MQIQGHRKPDLFAIPIFQNRLTLSLSIDHFSLVKLRAKRSKNCLNLWKFPPLACKLSSFSRNFVKIGVFKNRAGGVRDSFPQDVLYAVKSPAGTVMVAKEEIDFYNKWKDFRRGHLVLYALVFLTSCGAAFSFHLMLKGAGEVTEKCLLNNEPEEERTKRDVGTTTVATTTEGRTLDLSMVPLDACRFVLGSFMFSAAVSFIFGWFQAAFLPSVRSFVTGS